MSIDSLFFGPKKEKTMSRTSDTQGRTALQTGTGYLGRPAHEQWRN